MKKFLLGLILCIIWSADVKSEETAVSSNASAHGEIRTGNYVHGKINRQILSPDEDDLYSGTEIKPLNKEMSLEEKSQPNSTDVYFIDEKDLPEDIPCNNENLRRQVASFLASNLKSDSSDSVLQKRARDLLIKNLHSFTEVPVQDIDNKNFSLSSSLAYLRINKNRSNMKVCVSSENKSDTSKNFKDVFIIIYPFANFQKVVVTNLLSDPEKIDDVTFVYNW